MGKSGKKIELTPAYISVRGETPSTYLQQLHSSIHIRILFTLDSAMSQKHINTLRNQEKRNLAIKFGKGVYK
jgi:hypothetical protein